MAATIGHIEISGEPIMDVYRLRDMLTEPKRVLIVGHTTREADEAFERLVSSFAPSLIARRYRTADRRPRVQLVDGTLIASATAGDRLRGVTADLVVTTFRATDEERAWLRLVTITRCGRIAHLDLAATDQIDKLSAELNDRTAFTVSTAAPGQR